MGYVRNLSRTCVYWVVISTVLLLAGCAGSKGALTKPIFWPPEPALPRIQYLKSIGSSADVVEKKKFSLLALGDEQNDAIPIVKPYGIAVKGSKIYVCDTIAAEVLIIDFTEKKMTKLPGNTSMGKLKKPVNATVDKDGSLFVADASRQEVLVYDAEGNFKRTYGNGLGIKPVDVSVDDSNIYVLDVDHSRINIIDRKSDKVVGSLGQQNEGDQNLSLPTNMSLDKKGFLYVTNIGTSKVVKLDHDGHFLGSIGRVGTGLGQFGRPKGIAIDDDDLVYVVDTAAQNVQIFDDQLRLLLFFGNPGVARGYLNIPAGIAVSSENLDYFQKLAAPDFVIEKVIYVVSQFGDDKINIYGLGKKNGLDYDADIKQALDERKKLEEQYRLEAEKKRKEAEEKKQEKPVQPSTMTEADAEIEKAKAAKKEKAGK